MAEDDKKPEGEKDGKEPEPGVIKLSMVSIPVPKRTFNVIDRLIAFPFEGLLGRLEEKRKRNIEAHIEAVNQRATSPANDNQTISLTEPSIQTAILLDGWISKAGTFGEEERDIAAAWRAALERIKSGDLYADLILAALSSLSVSELAEFLFCLKELQTSMLNWLGTRLFARRLQRKSPDLAMKLSNLGLISDELVKTRLSLVVIDVVIFTLVVLFVLYFAIDAFENSSSSTFDTIWFGSFMFLIVYFFSKRSSREVAKFVLPRFRLTEAGKRFAESYKKYS